MAYVYTFLWSLVPVVELRGSIPLGYFNFGLSIFEAFLVSVCGGIVVAFCVLFWLPFVVSFVEKRVGFLHRFLLWLFARTRAKHSHRVEMWGAVFLVVLVSLPLPGSGSWTGALLAYLFGMSRFRALLLIALGVVFSGIFVSFLTVVGGQLAIGNV